MPVLIRHFFAVLLHLGALGLVILGVLDSSFLFLPVGNDLLLIALVARHHGQFLVYVLAALGAASWENAGVAISTARASRNGVFMADHSISNRNRQCDDFG